MATKHRFDNLDHTIICELRKNARLSSADIARKHKLNERTVRNRIDSLIERGIIRLTAIVNPYSFDYVVAVDVFLEASMDHEQAILDKLLSMSEISYVAYGQGSTDLSIEARFKDNNQMREFLRRTLPAIPGIKVKGYALVPRVLRSIDEWMPPVADFH
jgi:DNA-binding Lrp family transcriptional regulator